MERIGKYYLSKSAERFTRIFLITALCFTLSQNLSAQLASNFTVNLTTVCAGSPVTFNDLTQNITGSPTYSWNFGAGASPATASGPGPHNVVYSVAGQVTVSLSVTDDTGTDEEIKTDYITVSGIAPAFTACPGSTIIQGTDPGYCTAVVDYSLLVTVAGSPAPVLTYSFSGATTGTGTGTGSGSVFNLGNTVVTIEATSSCSTTASCSFSVLVGSSPIAFAGGPYESCQGSSVQLNGASSTEPDAACGDAITYYGWDMDNNGIDDVTGVYPTLTHAMLVGYGLGVGSHTIRLTVQDRYGMSDSENTTLTINPLPVAPVAQPGLSAGCTQIIANWQSAAAATSYLLDVSTSNTFATFVTGYENRDVGNVTTYTVTGLVSGTTYYYRVRAVNGCGTSASSGVITYATLSAPSQPGIISGSSVLCSGVIGQVYSVADVATATSYTWTLPAGWIITGGDATRSITVTAGTSSGTVSVTASNSCGTSPARTLDVTVNLTPSVTNQSTSINSGQIFTVTPAGTPVGTTYTWSAPAYTNGVTGGVAQSTGVASISGTLTIPSGSGTATYTVTPTASMCVGNTFMVTVTVNTACTPVTVTTQPVAASMCAGGSEAFSVVAGGTSPFVYQWEYSSNGTTWSTVANASPAGASYSGATGPSLTVSGITTAGTYQYRCHITNCSGGNSTISNPATLTVNANPPQPVITADGPVTFCSGEDVVLTATESAGYQWSNGATTRSITVNTSGTFTVQVTNATGCQSAQSAITAVTVNSLPATPTVGTITQPTCTLATGSVVLGGLPAGSWTINPGNISGSGTPFTVTGLTEGSYSFTVTNSNGCTSVATAPVLINAPPAVPTAPVIGTVTQPTCAVTTGSVGISGLPSSGNWTLTRNPGGFELSGSGTTFTATGIPAGTYTYTVSNASGCVSPASVSFTVNSPLPVPAVPSQTVDCTLGFNFAVVTVTTPSETGLNYRLDAGTWQTSNVFTNVANGTHTVSVRNSSLCVTTGPEFSVNCGCVNPPLLTLSASSGTTCGITAKTVNDNTFGGSATSVTITENGGGTVTQVSSTTSPFSFTYTPVAGDAGRVVVITVTTNNPLGSPCAAASATYSLSVNANPVAPVTGTVTHPTCALPTGSVVLNSLPATGDWTITRNPGGITTSGSGTSTTITGLSAGTYTFTVTNANGCLSAASSTVVINAQPETPAAPLVGAITQPTCALSTGSVVLSELPATGNWSLTRMPGNVIINGSGAARTVTSIPSGTYTYTVTNAAGCVSPSSADVVINPQPVTPNTPVIGTITHPTCELATGTIVLDNMPETGEWTLIRYPGGASLTGSGSSVTVSSLPAGIYNFTVTNADGCTSPVSANAVINAQPPTPASPVIGTITHPTFQVPTGSVVLSGLPSTGTWTLTRYPDGFTSQGSGTTRTVTGLEPGTYNFAVTNAAGCTSGFSSDVVINARPGAPVVVINNPPAICENETSDLTLPAVTAGSDLNLTFTYWTDAAATVTYATPQTAPAGTYYIMGTSTAGYYTIKPVVVTADEIPVANAGPDQVLEYKFGTTLNADIPDIGTGMWELVSGTGDLFNAIAYSTPVSGLSAGENVFSWTVTNGACDPVSDLIVITVNNLTVPTLITPNQDGRNDFFVLRGLETLGRTELTIFDRRGLKVYENNDYQNDWDGFDYNSNPLPDDTYFWVIRADNGVSVNGYVVVRR